MSNARIQFSLASEDVWNAYNPQLKEGEIVTVLKGNKKVKLVQGKVGGSTYSESTVIWDEDLAETTMSRAEAAAVTATEQATAANDSASAAADSQSAAATSAINAKASATAAKTSETNTKASEIAAKNSATSAASSASTASTQAGKAADSAIAAAGSATQAGTFATTATDKAIAADKSATAAAASAVTASDKASKAATSATSAAGAAEKAQAAKDDALNSQKLVEKYKALWFDSVAAMKAEKSLKPGAVACTLGYYVPNDGGAGTYIIRAKQESDIDDGGSLHELANGNVAELVVENGTVYPEQFGAKGDSVTDDTEALQRCFNFNMAIQFNANYVSHDTLTINSKVNANNHYLFARHDNDVIKLGVNAELSNIQILTNTSKRAISIIGKVRQRKPYLKNIILNNDNRVGTGVYIEANDGEYTAYCNFDAITILNFDVGIHLKANGTGFIQGNNFNSIINTSRQFILEEGEETNGNVYVMSADGNEDNRISKTKGCIQGFVIDPFGPTFDIKNEGGYVGYCEALGVNLTPDESDTYYVGFLNASGGYAKNIAGTTLDVYAKLNKSTALAGYYAFEDNFDGNTINSKYTLSNMTVITAGDHNTGKNQRGDHGFRLIAKAADAYLYFRNHGVTVAKMPTFEMITAVAPFYTLSEMANVAVEFGIMIGDKKLGFTYDYAINENNATQIYFFNPITGNKELLKNVLGENMKTFKGDKHIIRIRITPTAISVRLCREGFDKLVSLDSYSRYRQNAITTANLTLEHNFLYETITPFVQHNRNKSDIIVEYMKLESTRIPCY